MDGNHYFSTLDQEQVWNEKVEKLLGGKKAEIWNEEKTNSPLFNQEILFPMIKGYVAKI